MYVDPVIIWAEQYGSVPAEVAGVDCPAAPRGSSGLGPVQLLARFNAVASGYSAVERFVNSV